MNLLIIVFTFAVCYGKHTDNSAVYINDQPNKQEITTAKYDTTTIPIEQPAHNNDHDLVKSKQNITDEQMAMMDMITPLPKPHTTTPCTNITVTLNLVNHKPLSESVKQSLPVWQKRPISQIPIEQRVSYGHKINGKTVYICRIKQTSNLLPGKIDPAENICHGSVGGVEFKNSVYEVLTNSCPENLSWSKYTSSGVPNGALYGGQEHPGDKSYPYGLEGETYITRANVSGEWVAGKMHVKQSGLMWYMYNGGEMYHTGEFEILVFKV